MADRKIRKMVLAAMLAALVTVATMVVRIPSPTNGYVNLGDCFVLLAGWLLGPWYGAAAAGIGSMLTDLLSGYAYYAPVSLLVKGLDAFVAAKIYAAMHKRRGALVVSGVVGELIMAAGYFGYTALLLGKGLTAALSIPGNLVQGALGIAAGSLLMALAKRTHLTEKI